MMISASTLLHVRLPFSWFLLPVYMMALAFSPSIDLKNAVIVFIVLHVFLFTASNGFNSYYDRDIDSIGGLRTPPPVTRDLLWFSLALDAAGIALALAAGWVFALGSFVYGIASKLYSWDRTRFKKRGIESWLLVGFGQGSCVFLLTGFSVAPSGEAGLANLAAGIIPSLFIGCFLLGVFPLTQIYQHTEDARRGDMTISRMLGIEKTFYIAAICIVFAICGLCYCFFRYSGPTRAFLFLGLLAPAVYYFGRWFLSCRKNPSCADFSHCMRMNFLASTCLNCFGIAALFFVR
jgi:4-hydroxybenzoate polyprenyltransferase